MKKFIALIALAMGLLINTADAQQRTARGQNPNITAKGDFNNALFSRTVTATYTSRNNASFPLLYSVLDTVDGAAGVDTLTQQVVGDYNSVTLQWNLTKIGGRVDSFTVTYWASIDGVNYVSIGSPQTATNTAGTKAYSYIVNSGNGNTYTHYMLTAACTNVASGSSGAWKGYLLIR